jgi:hypothetical protein
MFGWVASIAGAVHLLSANRTTRRVGERGVARPSLMTLPLILGSIAVICWTCVFCMFFAAIQGPLGRVDGVATIVTGMVGAVCVAAALYLTRDRG